MKIIDNHGNEIQTLDDWAKIYNTPRGKVHWKEGRSAYSIADYVINHNGLAKISDRVAEVLDEGVEFSKVTPELELRIDEYGRGRVHDLGIYGHTTSSNSIFIGLESKVDESFNRSIGEVYLEAKAKQIGGSRTKAPDRIEELLKKHFRKPDKNVFQLRYQLLYATVGTLAAKQDISVMYILVFKTDLYDDLKALDNLKDYIAFINANRSEELPSSRPESKAHLLKIGRKNLYSIYEQVVLK